MKKIRKAVPCPELTLRAAERRKRAKRMARIETGCNAITKRQLRHLPNASSRHAVRKGKRLLKRYFRKQGMTMADLS